MKLIIAYLNIISWSNKFEFLVDIFRGHRIEFFYYWCSSKLNFFESSPIDQFKLLKDLMHHSSGLILVYGGGICCMLEKISQQNCYLNISSRVQTNNKFSKGKIWPDINILIPKVSSLRELLPVHKMFDFSTF